MAKLGTGVASPSQRSRISSRSGVRQTNVADLQAEVGRLRERLDSMGGLQEAVERLTAQLSGDAAGRAVSAEAPRKWPNHLKTWRTSRGKNLGDIAEACGLSVSQISRVENGYQSYTQKILEGYASVLGCRPADLLSHSPYEPRKALAPLFAQMGFDDRTTRRIERLIGPSNDGGDQQKG
jgi:transcriptional regulator with XRE-family HTH domain